MAAHRIRTSCRCGFTVDEQGRKMSKSLGNGVDPADVTSKWGADVLALVGRIRRLRAGRVHFRQHLERRSPTHIAVSATRSASCWATCLTSTIRRMRFPTGTTSSPSTSRHDAPRPPSCSPTSSRPTTASSSNGVYRAVYDFVVNDLSSRVHGRHEGPSVLRVARQRRAVVPCRRC